MGTGAELLYSPNSQAVGEIRRLRLTIWTENLRVPAQIKQAFDVLRNKHLWHMLTDGLGVDTGELAQSTTILVLIFGVWWKPVL